MSNIRLIVKLSARNDNLLRLMEDNNISGPTELSKILNIKTSRIHKLLYLKQMNRTVVTNDTVIKIAEYFRVPPDYIISQDLIDSSNKFKCLKTKEEKICNSKEFNTMVYNQEQRLLVESDPEAVLIETDMKEDVHNMLNKLSEREQIVLSMRFGLNDGVERTLEEIGKRFKVTNTRASQILRKTLRRLKHPTRSRAVREYLM